MRPALYWVVKTHANYYYGHFGFTPDQRQATKFAAKDLAESAAWLGVGGRVVRVVRRGE